MVAAFRISLPAAVKLIIKAFTFRAIAKKTGSTLEVGIAD
jgi:hypothetical protein